MIGASGWKASATKVKVTSQGTSVSFVSGASLTASTLPISRPLAISGVSS
jgi:hypothetical protein